MSSTPASLPAVRTDSLLQRYLAAAGPGEVSPGAAAFFAGLETIGAVSPDIAAAVVRELAD